MKSYLFVFLCCFPLVLFAQEGSSFDLMVGGDNSFRLFSKHYKKLIKNNRQGELGYRIGFNYNRKISDKLFLKTGLRYFKNGYVGANLAGIVAGEDQINIIGVTPQTPTFASDLKRVTDYYFLELPIMVRYEFKDKKWQPYIEAGLSGNLYMQTEEIKVLEIAVESQVIFEDQVNKYQLSCAIAFGINYLMASNVKLFLQPISRYHITQLQKESIVQHLASIGVELGTRINLK